MINNINKLTYIFVNLYKQMDMRSPLYFHNRLINIKDHYKRFLQQNGYKNIDFRMSNYKSYWNMVRKELIE